jgi:hypothetical protein
MNHAFSVFAGALAVLTVASCSETYTSPTFPTRPTPPVIGNGSFIGNIMDVDTRRVCIENARAEIIAGPSSGTTYPQNLDSCEDPGAGFVINDLPVDAVVRLRASAPGYTSVERDFVISQSARSIDINLKRAD